MMTFTHYEGQCPVGCMIILRTGQHCWRRAVGVGTSRGVRRGRSPALSFSSSQLARTGIAGFQLQATAMALTDSPRRWLIPGLLYTSSSSRTVALEKLLAASSSPETASTDAASSPAQKSFVIPSPSEPDKKKIEMYSPEFYAACTAGGILSCGLTHMAVTPLDLVKCNMQVT